MDLYLIASITRTRTGLIDAAEALQAEALPYMAELSEPARRRACLSGQVGQCSSSHQLSHSSPRMSARTCGRLCAFAPDHPITRTRMGRIGAADALPYMAELSRSPQLTTCLRGHGRTRLNSVSWTSTSEFGQLSIHR